MNLHGQRTWSVRHFRYRKERWVYWDDGRLGTRKLERLVKILLLGNQTGLKIEFLEEVKTRDVTEVKVVIG